MAAGGAAVFIAFIGLVLLHKKKAYHIITKNTSKHADDNVMGPLLTL
ncbi:MAG: hypothetical protein ACI8RD_010731 [Bacillariaceae sp.]|jgi:hypothetical protein